MFGHLEVGPWLLEWSLFQYTWDVLWAIPSFKGEFSRWVGNGVRLLNYQHHDGCHSKDETQSQRRGGEVEITTACGSQVAGDRACWHMHGCVLRRGHSVECLLQPWVHSYIVFPQHTLSLLIWFSSEPISVPRRILPLHPGSCDVEKNLHQLPHEETLLWGREAKDSSKGGGEAHFSLPGMNLRAEKL